MKIEKKAKGKRKAIIWIAMAAIMLMVLMAMVPMSVAREADGSIISGDTLFIGEHGLHFDAASYSDATSLKKLENGTVVL
ncbi:MAG: hypothetical protein J7K81_05435 [Methanophagales archaeon]|nr:hypothetical protein [Methanophagales archaeon]